jgi:hypothetical protein
MQTKLLMIGYIPLFYPPVKPGALLEPEAIKNMNIQSLNTYGCIWTHHQNQINPIIVCDKAKEVVDHINYYSEGNVEDWFEFFTILKEEEYTIGLHPKLDRICNRFQKINSNFQNMNIFYQPLSARCPLSSHYAEFYGSYVKASTMNLALIDVSDAKKLTPMQQINDDYIHHLGEFKINHQVTASMADPSPFVVRLRNKEARVAD